MRPEHEERLRRFLASCDIVDAKITAAALEIQRICAEGALAESKKQIEDLARGNSLPAITQVTRLNSSPSSKREVPLSKF
ncbi:hypothetical protein BCR33DRAFT_716837 [Rhizoclosmatium globosum]|uniref:Uncharacterized protein n=1 Tax=Rhizoclosmatium globosum TaxID=329046 RepID=A0A1Y2CDM9_9FUNG|nr:hypothetical protein BCR33DRAFT_716837 [Rhizoclosmatium globosum]|eukprot:ORY44924.1 hypothetical protein BCR33DRAFT_716837 [Rhizoclosmatium globosum]